MVDFKKAAAKRKREAAAALRRPANSNKPNDHNETPRPQFLKAGDIGNGARLQPIAGGSVRTMNGQFGQQLVIDVTLKGTTYSWGIGCDKPNMRLLVESLINNPGKAIPVRTMISAQNRPYIAIVQAEAPKHQPDDDIPF